MADVVSRLPNRDDAAQRAAAVLRDRFGSDAKYIADRNAMAAAGDAATEWTLISRALDPSA